jgi:hypothetical protein
MWKMILCLMLMMTTSLATTYQSHNISFDIPANWSLVSDQWINRTQIDGTLLTDAKMELTDNQSTIRIDVVEFQQLAWYLDTFCHKGGFCLELTAFYQDAVLRTTLGGSRGTTQNGYFFLFFDSGDWMLVKPVNDEQIVGVYGTFNGMYEVQAISDSSFDMPQPLYDVSNSLKVLDGATKQFYGAKEAKIKQF